MPLDKLTGATFHAAIIAGYHNLTHYKQELNEINVFPVADGDTGDNLSSTCMAIIVHADEKNQALHLTDMTTRAFDKSPTYIELVSLAIALHAGQGCIALAGRMSPGDAH